MGNTGEYMGAWSQAQRDYCCATANLACPTQPATQSPTPPPTPPPTLTVSPNRPIIPIIPRPIVPPAPTPPADPYNCAVGRYLIWAQPKKDWCCTNRHVCGQPTEAPAPADPYNCADGFSNWSAGWSVGKKEWCCRVHGKGCPNSGGGCAPNLPTAVPLPYDCEAGFANWVDGARRRSSGAARMEERVALPRTEVVLEHFSRTAGPRRWCTAACAPSSGADSSSLVVCFSKQTVLAAVLASCTPSSGTQLTRIP